MVAGLGERDPVERRVELTQADEDGPDGGANRPRTRPGASLIRRLDTAVRVRLGLEPQVGWVTAAARERVRIMGA